MDETEKKEIAMLVRLAKDVGSDDLAVASKAGADLGIAMAENFKEALFPTDLHADLFQVESRTENEDVRYPTDLIAVGREKEFKAYHVPRWGGPAERVVEQDYLRIATHDYINNLEIPLPALRQGDYNAIARAIEVLWEGVNMTMNDICFKTVLAAAAGRGFQVTSTAAEVTAFGLGALPKSLISRMQTKQRRASNASSSKSFRMTRAYMSPELRETITQWDNTKVDELTRREVIMGEDGKISGVYQCEFRDIDELGAVGDYQLSAINDYGYTLTTAGGVRTELIVGVDARPVKKSRFVMPVCKMPELIDDSAAYRRRNLASWYMRFNFGAGILDNRGCIFGDC